MFTKSGFFQLNPPYRVGEIAFGGEIALRAVKSGSTPGGWIKFHRERKRTISSEDASPRISPRQRRDFT
ncbi:MAG: hypothetical protein J5766_03545, partial [Clostridia bacterium]|nr:hypothetical protein [Clostridia bacterium]